MLAAVDSWLDLGRKQTVTESPRLDEAAESFLVWVQDTESLRPRTKGKLRNRLNLFRNSVPNLRVADISPDVIEKFFAARKVSALTKIGDRAAISRFFSWCIDRPRRWTATNPCREIRLEKKHDQPAPAVLTVADCSKLLTEAEVYKEGLLVPYVTVCLFGGLRPAEAQRLTWDSGVNLVDREIRIESQSSKTKRPRVVTIDETLHAWLVAYANKPFSPPSLRRHLDALKVRTGYTGRSDERHSTTLKPWPADVLRHTAISHYFRKTGSYGQTAEQFGNSEAIIKGHYQGRVNSEETAKFYAIMPSKGVDK
jgi:integrase